MGPTKVKTGSSRGNNKRSSKPSSSASSSKNKKQSSIHKAARASKSKVKKVQTKPKKKGRRWYPEEELQLPKLNMVTPAGVGKPKGKKKGKVFVDDPESMRTILAMVKAEKDGQIESKMIRARQMEEIRLARQKEMEARAEEKKAKLVRIRKLSRYTPYAQSY